MLFGRKNWRSGNFIITFYIQIVDEMNDRSGSFMKLTSALAFWSLFKYQWIRNEFSLNLMKMVPDRSYVCSFIVLFEWICANFFVKTIIIENFRKNFQKSKKLLSDDFLLENPEIRVNSIKKIFEFKIEK